MSNITQIEDVYQHMRPRRICLCKGVTEEDIREAINLKGARDFDGVQQITRCCTGCGTCETRVRKLVEEIINT